MSPCWKIFLLKKNEKFWTSIFVYWQNLGTKLKFWRPLISSVGNWQLSVGKLQLSAPPPTKLFLPTMPLGLGLTKQLDWLTQDGEWWRKCLVTSDDGTRVTWPMLGYVMSGYFRSQQRQGLKSSGQGMPEVAVFQQTSSTFNIGDMDAQNFILPLNFPPRFPVANIVFLEENYQTRRKFFARLHYCPPPVCRDTTVCSCITLLPLHQYQFMLLCDISTCNASTVVSSLTNLHFMW